MLRNIICLKFKIKEKLKHSRYCDIMEMDAESRVVTVMQS